MMNDTHFFFYFFQNASSILLFFFFSFSSTSLLQKGSVGKDKEFIRFFCVVPFNPGPNPHTIANDGTSATPQVLFPMARYMKPSCPHVVSHELRTIQYGADLSLRL